MSSINSTMASLQNLHLQYRTQITASTPHHQTGKTIEHQPTQRTEPQPLTNQNTLLNSETSATMFALTQNTQQSAGVLNEKIASLSGMYTPIESLMNDQSKSFDYLSAVSNPQATMARTQNNYNNFLQDAQTVVDEMESMDDTGLLTFRFTKNGPSVETNSKYEKLGNKQTTATITQKLAAADNTRQKIEAWIAENKEKHSVIAEKGAEYIYAKSAADHKSTTGTSRDEAVQKGYDEIQRYTLTISRNAANHYGINPMSAAESTERFGEAGVLTYAAR